MGGFLVYALGGFLGLITLIGAVITAVRRGMAPARSALAIGAILSGIFVMSALPGRSVPRINDITTDTDNPPKFVHAGTLAANRGRDMSYPGIEFATQQKAGYPTLAPLRLPVGIDEAFRRVEAAARDMAEWELTRVDLGTHSIEGVATTALFRFQDDFVIEVRPEANGSAVHMRSKSRDGKGDLGANAARIEAFFAKLR
jgi:uncharacterized protein (DUF1499 family)